MLVELHTKGGNLCLHAKEGKIHCPLIVRPTSEDVVTGQIVQSLSLINPRHWVSDLLNEALGMRQFSRQIYRKFRIEPWVGKPPFPRELLKWDEGSTEVDVQITWENPPTTIFIEAKYGSKLSAGTANNNGQHGFPSDQLVRNIRVGLHECGYYRTNALFETQRRNFAVIVLAPDAGQPLVKEYRVLENLKAAIPHSNRITWPTVPFVGEIGYRGIRDVLLPRRRFATRAERQVIDSLDEYLCFKHQSRPNRTTLPMARANAPPREVLSVAGVTHIRQDPAISCCDRDPEPNRPRKNESAPTKIKFEVWTTDDANSRSRP